MRLGGPWGCPGKWMSSHSHSPGKGALSGLKGPSPSSLALSPPRVLCKRSHSCLLGTTRDKI